MGLFMKAIVKVTGKLFSTISVEMTDIIMLLSLMLISCSRNMPASDNNLTASVSLNIPLVGESLSRVPVNGDENAVNELRVVILSQNSDKSINQVFTREEIENNGGKITIAEVPVGIVQMYVIANEKSLGKNYDDLANLQKDVIQVDESRKVLIIDAGRSFFPKRGSEFPSSGLPMSWMSKNLSIMPASDSPQVIEVNLQRCVAKLNINMQSTLTEEIVIREMYFGKFFGDRLYLFQEKNLDVPYDDNYESKDFLDLDIRIPANGEENLVCYIYPSFAWKTETESSPYTIGFKTQNNVNYPPQQFVNNFGALNSIARNTQVNITAKLSKHSDINISFEVVPWIEETVDVPSFN